MINYPCAKFGDFSVSRLNRFGFIVRTVTDRQTDRITESQMRMSNFLFMV